MSPRVSASLAEFFFIHKSIFKQPKAQILTHSMSDSPSKPSNYHFAGKTLDEKDVENTAALCLLNAEMQQRFETFVASVKNKDSINAELKEKDEHIKTLKRKLRDLEEDNKHLKHELKKAKLACSDKTPK